MIIQTFVNNNLEYIITFLILLIFFLIYILFRSNKKIKDLNRRIEVLENFDNVLATIKKDHNSSHVDNTSQKKDNFIEREETKQYKGNTRLERLVNEYKDTVIHSDKK